MYTADMLAEHIAILVRRDTQQTLSQSEFIDLFKSFVDYVKYNTIHSHKNMMELIIILQNIASQCMDTKNELVKILDIIHIKTPESITFTAAEYRTIHITKTIKNLHNEFKNINLTVNHDAIERDIEKTLSIIYRLHNDKHRETLFGKTEKQTIYLILDTIMTYLISLKSTRNEHTLTLIHECFEQLHKYTKYNTQQ